MKQDNEKTYKTKRLLVPLQLFLALFPFNDAIISSSFDQRMLKQDYQGERESTQNERNKREKE